MGAFVSDVLLTLGRYGFHYYLLWFKADDPLNVIYGSVALVPIFLVWLYLVWVVVLLGVEVAYVGQNFGTLWAAEQEQRLSKQRAFKVPTFATVLGILLALAKSHEQGEPPLGYEALARLTGLSQRSIHPLLEVLQKQGWAVETEAGWLLAKSATAIQIHQVARAWYKETAPDGTGRSEAVIQLQRTIEEGVEGTLTGTLQDAMERWI